MVDGLVGGNILGLSPLTRGKLGRSKSLRLRMGPIPADAGETLFVFGRRDPCRAYPR